MISCLVLERWSRWRVVGVGFLLGLCLLPAAPTLTGAFLSGADVRIAWTPTFARSAGNSLLIAALVGVASLFIGLPLGVVLALYRTRIRTVLLPCLALPLLLPSFLLAIGWSSLALQAGYSVNNVVNGITGCSMVFCASGVPLVLLTTLAACGSLSESQVQAARLAGGERAVLQYVSRYAFAPSLLAAIFAAIFSVSEPGPGQIFGVHTAGAEILTTLSAQYDFDLAARQCAILATIVLLIVIPPLLMIAPRFADAILARQTRPLRGIENPRIARIALLGFVVAVLILVAAPMTGLLWPLARGFEFQRAISELSRTWLNTLLYGLMAGVFAAFVSVVLALLIGRTRILLTGAVVVLAAVFVLPPALGALGVLRTRGMSPAWADPLLATRFTVGAVLAFRLLPVAAVLMCRAWRSTSASWNLAAAVHGVPLQKYIARVIVPILLPAIATCMLLVGLLATSDIVTVLLLHPPGEATLPLAIFTVMANAPESLVASLCLVQAAVAFTVLVGVVSVARFQRS